MIDSEVDVYRLRFVDIAGDGKTLRQPGNDAPIQE